MAKNRKRLKHNSVGVKIVQETKRVKNPRKQRKRLFNAPAHIRHKFMSAPLSSELAASRGVKTLPVRKGDTVRILRGDSKGFEGKVSRVALNEYRIYIEGLTREKVDGTNIFLPIHPSKVQIRNLNLEDGWRKDILARKKEIEKPEEEEKPKAITVPKAEEVPEKAAKAPKKAPAAKKAPAKKAPAEKPARAKKPAAKKEAVPKKKAPAKEEAAPVEEEKALAKKAAKPKTKAKKTAAPKKAPAKKAAAKKTAAKPRAKRKASEGTEGGQ
jgi:large subunit ribosomal protein L24